MHVVINKNWSFSSAKMDFSSRNFSPGRNELSLALRENTKVKEPADFKVHAIEPEKTLNEFLFLLLFNLQLTPKHKRYKNYNKRS